MVRICGLALIMLTSATASEARPPRALVIHDVTVIPMDRERSIPHQDVWVRGGMIAAIGGARRARFARDVEVIDGRGKYLIPGLVDFHTHPTSPDELISYLAYGQTTIATLAGEGLGLRAFNAIGPRMLSSSFILDGNPPINRRFFAVHDPQSASEIVRQMKKRGAAFLKVYSRMKAPELASLGSAARAQGLGIVGHIPQKVPLDQALDSINVVAHGEEYFNTLGESPSDAALRDVAALTASKHAVVIPNLAAYAAMPRQAARIDEEMAATEMRYLPSETYQEWLPQNNRYATRSNIPEFVNVLTARMKVLKRLVIALRDAGVPLLAGTDAPVICYPGKCLLEDINLLHSAGLSNFEALRAATATAGEVWRTTLHGPERFGTVTVGSRADLLLLDGNPLQSLHSLSSIEGVIVDGRWMSKQRIATLRSAAAVRQTRLRKIVDRYERLLESEDFKGLTALLVSTKGETDIFNLNVILYDMLILDEAGHRADAIRLGKAAEAPLGRNHGLWNVLGNLQLLDGRFDEAAASFRRSLQLAPLNGVAIDGAALARRHAKPENY